MLSPTRYDKSVTLAQALINTSGYGKVKKDLISTGFWDESLDPNKTRFIVHATAEIMTTEAGHAEIYAVDMEEAKNLANALNNDAFEWDSLSSERGEVESISIEEVVLGED